MPLDERMYARQESKALFGATLALVAVLVVGMGIAQIGGAAWGLGYIDGSTAGAIGMMTGGGGSVVTGLSAAGVISSSTMGAGLVVLGGATL